MPAARTYQFKITLEDVNPEVWRRLLVPSDLLLVTLHEILQVTMGWENYHLHAFTIRGTRYGRPDKDESGRVIDERKQTIGALVDLRERFTYEYDFGDGWIHLIDVEKPSAPIDATPPTCVDGRGACPPEDCGGPRGYAELLQALADPAHERHEELGEWVEGSFDADAFDVAAVNKSLAELARPRRARRKLH